jgi:transcriptional regulator of acetoin/glycerol metabolism
MLTDGSHARLVHSVIRGTSPSANAPEHVMRSWLRCVDEYGLDPESSAQPAVLSQQEFVARKEQSLELMSFADTELAHLHRQLAGSGHSIILTDRDGVLLSYYGDPSFRHAAASATAAPTAWEPVSPSARRSSCIATSTSSPATPA